jgi:hypothetical protein
MLSSKRRKTGRDDAAPWWMETPAMWQRRARQREGMILSVKSRWEKKKREEFEGREEKTVLMIQVAAVSPASPAVTTGDTAPASRNRKRREPGHESLPWLLDQVRVNLELRRANGEAVFIPGTAANWPQPRDPLHRPRRDRYGKVEKPPDPQSRNYLPRTYSTRREGGPHR